MIDDDRNMILEYWIALAMIAATAMINDGDADDGGNDDDDDDDDDHDDDDDNDGGTTWTTPTTTTTTTTTPMITTKRDSQSQASRHRHGHSSTAAAAVIVGMYERTSDMYQKSVARRFIAPYWIVRLAAPAGANNKKAWYRHCPQIKGQCCDDGEWHRPAIKL